MLAASSTHGQKEIEMPKKQELHTSYSNIVVLNEHCKRKKDREGVGGEKGGKKTVLKQPRRNSMLPCTFVN